MTSYSEFFKGIKAHIPRNFVLALTGFNYFTSINIYTYLIKGCAFHSLAYPILTVQRRLECQTTSRHGMLPLRYLGILHCFGLMWKEEGLKGLYRGYIAYLLATLIYLTVVPMFAEVMMMKSKLYGNFEDDDELYEEVMKKKK